MCFLLERMPSRNKVLTRFQFYREVGRIKITEHKSHAWQVSSDEKKIEYHFKQSMYLFCMHDALHGTTNMTGVFAFSSPKVVAKAL